jgi:hypothetical protein
VAFARPRARDRLAFRRLGVLFGSTLLIALTLVVALDPDDDDEQRPVLPAAATATAEAPTARPGSLRMAKDFRLRPRKSALRKRPRLRWHLHESGPPVQVQQRTRRGTNAVPHLCLPDEGGRIALVDLPASWAVFTPVVSPAPTVAPPPRLTRAPPAHA